MKATNLNGVKVYNLSAGATLPEFLERSQKKKISSAENAEYKKRIELMQQFEFNIASNKIVVSSDKQYIAACGVYPPEIRMYDTKELGLKFVRRIDSEVVDFTLISEDYKKIAMLQQDRTVEFHAQGGRQHKIRIPRTGRCLNYYSESAELYIAGSSKEIYRFDLEQGSFAEPITSENLEEINFCAINPSLPLLLTGGTDGIVEAYDLRTSKCVSTIRAGMNSRQIDSMSSATCASFSPNGMQVGIGMDDGIVRLYDIRSARILSERNHRNGVRINSIELLNNNHAMRYSNGNMDEGDTASFTGTLVCSTDNKCCKIWSSGEGVDGGSVLASLELDDESVINYGTVFPDSGLVFLAGDRGRIGTYFMPSLGVAPSWCSWLDSLTEELEETNTTKIFDDLHFITRSQLEQWGVTNLIGTPLLHSYMHGYFINNKLYQKLKDKFDIHDDNQYRQKKIDTLTQTKKMSKIKQIQQEQEKKKINEELAKKLQNVVEESKKSSSKRAREAEETANTILSDSRFARLFNDPDFAIEQL